jgi:hypothetical protein
MIQLSNIEEETLLKQDDKIAGRVWIATSLPNTSPKKIEVILLRMINYTAYGSSPIQTGRKCLNSNKVEFVLHNRKDFLVPKALW